MPHTTEKGKLFFSNVCRDFPVVKFCFEDKQGHLQKEEEGRPPPVGPEFVPREDRDESVSTESGATVRLLPALLPYGDGISRKSDLESDLRHSLLLLS